MALNCTVLPSNMTIYYNVKLLESQRFHQIFLGVCGGKQQKGKFRRHVYLQNIFKIQSCFLKITFEL